MMPGKGTTVRWEILPNIPTPRAYAAVIIFGDRLYIFGGCDVRGKSLDAAEAFSFTHRRWEELPKMTFPRAGGEVVEEDGRLILLGGCASNNKPLATVECFDTCKKTWSILPSLPRGLMGSATVNVNKRTYVIGGTDGRNECSNACYYYEYGNASWKKSQEMPTRRYACLASVYKNQIFVTGGRVVKDPVLAVESLDTRTGTWKTHPNILVRSVFDVKLQHGNGVYRLGGLQGTENFISAADFFDFERKEWRSLSSMPSKRADMTSGVLMDHIVITGGMCENGPAKTTELLDLRSSEWYTIPEMPTHRCAAVGVTYGNMFVVVSGLGLNGPCPNVEALILDADD